MKTKFTLLVMALCCYVSNFAQFTNPQIDPGLEGNFTTEAFEYSADDILLPSLPGRNFRVLATGHRPIGNGPFPLVLLVHGRHNTCYVNAGTLGFIELPCGSAQAENEIPNHEGFTYLSEFLASHGYITASIDNNDIIRAVQLDEPSDNGAQARAELIQFHLDLWKRFNQTNEQNFSGELVGKIDLQNIITMGHSRGGEAVVKHFLHNESLGSPYVIKGVFAVAPANDNNFVAPGMNYAVAVPYCDGDVRYAAGAWNYDRQAEQSESAAHMILLKGANHNYFNTVWSPGGFEAGTGDDWEAATRNTDENSKKNFYCNPVNFNRYGQTKQRNVLKAYFHSFIKTYIDNDLAYAEPIFGTNRVAPTSTQLSNFEKHISYHAPSPKRKELHTVSNSLSDATQTSSGGIITHNNFQNFGICGSVAQNYNCGPANNPYDDHRSTDRFGIFQTGLARLLVSWERQNDDPAAWFEQSITAQNSNATNYSHFTFRVGITAYNPFLLNRGTISDFTIEVEDISGNKSTTTVREHSAALYVPPGSFGTTTPHNIAATVAIPFTAFAEVDFRTVKSIRFTFDKSNMGEYYFTDFAFTKYGKTDDTTLSIFDFENNKKTSEVIVYPNPTVDFINFSGSVEAYKIEIYDAKGSLVLVKDLPNGIEEKISVENLARGLYFVKINDFYTQKFLKK